MKFSIITVVKNDLSKIRLTFQSLKNQIFKDYEHIILTQIQPMEQVNF